MDSFKFERKSEGKRKINDRLDDVPIPIGNHSRRV